MASFTVSNDYLIICSKTEVTVVIKSGERPEKRVLSLPQRTDIDKKKCSGGPESNSLNGNFKTLLKISPSGKYLGVCSGKVLSVWLTEDWSLLNCRDVIRAPSNFVFTHSEKEIILADKSGDVYCYIVGEEVPPRLILGHLSVILDVLVSENDKYVITCDRDEKIRVSNWPNTYNIHCFCLGHKEFVSCIRFLPHNNNIVVSGSGDGTVKFWDYCNGLELCSFSLNEVPSSVLSSDKPFAVNELSIIKKDSSSSVICLSLSNVSKLIILSCELNEKLVECKYHSSLELTFEPSVIFTFGLELWILSSGEVNLSVFKWCNETNNFSCNQNDLVNLFCDLTIDIKKIIEITCKQDSIDYLYKKKYDNVQEYLVKKKARIEAAS